ncbi:MAG: hypothetical protein ACKVQB_01395 [Bacteroidia bacterium]
METQTQSDVLHSENLEWLKRLASYADEVNAMQLQIEGIAASYTSQSVMAKIEHFQNQLIIQKHRINSLKHSIKNNEKLINLDTNVADTDHASAKDQVNTFEKIISDLRQELGQFMQQAI